MNKKVNANKLFIFGVFLGLGYFLVPTLSHAMEIVFDKEYVISKKANITSLNWRAVTFSKVGAGRILYTLKAEHQDGVTLEYLKDIDSMVSKGIKNKMIGGYEIKSTKVDFKNGVATIEIELPYDFDTRYLPMKVTKKDGFEDYVVRLRFGDYKFLMANKMLNAVGALDPSRIASQDHSELYKNRKNLKKREVTKKAEQEVVSVDEIYSDMKSQAVISEASDVAKTKTATSSSSKDNSIYDQFENLSKQYEADAQANKKEAMDYVNNNNSVETVETVDVETEELMQTPSIESQVAKSSIEQVIDEPQLEETLPGKKEVVEYKPVSVDDMLADEDKPASQLVSAVPSYDEQIRALKGETSLDQAPSSDKVLRNISSAKENKTEEVSDVYDAKPPVWNFVYGSGFTFEFAKAPVEEKRVPSSINSNPNDSSGLNVDDLDSELSFEEQEESKKKDW